MVAHQDSILVAGVMGHPVQHSLSPEIFRFLGKVLNQPVVYRKMEVSPNDLPATVQALKKLSYLQGWNVTLPHKEKIARLMDHLHTSCGDARSKSLQVVNVVHVVNHKLHGFNTDIPGVLLTLQEARVPLSGASILLLGAGGASAAVLEVMGQERVAQVWIVSRNPARAKKRALEFRKRFPKTLFQALLQSHLLTFSERVTLYVNATPLGMTGFPEETLLPQNLTPGAFAFDLIYRPHETVFLREATEKGLVPVYGLDLLIWQALLTWEIWVGPIPCRQEIKTLLRNHLL